MLRESESLSSFSRDTKLVRVRKNWVVAIPVWLPWEEKGSRGAGTGQIPRNNNVFPQENLGAKKIVLPPLITTYFFIYFDYNWYDLVGFHVEFRLLAFWRPTCKPMSPGIKKKIKSKENNLKKQDGALKCPHCFSWVLLRKLCEIYGT